MRDVNCYVFIAVRGGASLEPGEGARMQPALAAWRASIRRTHPDPAGLQLITKTVVTVERENTPAQIRMASDYCVANVPPSA